jgi:thioredoxin reductase
MSMVEVAVVGAGPYGLSIASHLRAKGIEHRVFGTPMQTWRTQMPQGMFLKSEGFASNLYEPTRQFTLAEYCTRLGLPYANVGLPIGRDVFADYGVAFQRQCVPHLEQVDVVGLQQVPQGFSLTLANGETMIARQVVLAVGIRHFAHLPPALAALSPDFVSHSSRHANLGQFAGRDMLVMGAGASALDCAALLTKAGARVRLVARRAAIGFHSGPSRQQRSLKERVKAPQSGLGPGWKSRLCTDAPLLFHAMPEAFRLLVVHRHLGPAPGWWTRAMVEGKVEFHLGRQMQGVDIAEGRIRLALETPEGEQEILTADHLIAATGYRPDVARLQFLSPSLRVALRTAGDAPILSRNFESSVPGLYFVGPASANSFGPVARFAFGAGFTARRIANHLNRTRRRPQASAADAGQHLQLANAR